MMGKSSGKTNLAFGIFALIFCMLLYRPSHSLAAESLCAEVKLEIKQELTLERQAFDAHMRINNGLSNISLENVEIQVNFKDEDGNPVVASFDDSVDPEVTGTKFFIRVDSMPDNFNDNNGQGPVFGQVEPSSSADIHWLIIPVPGASGGQLDGKLYYVGANLTYEIGGEENVTDVTPDYIYVKPMPELQLDYFIPQEVFGDDAFTSEIEPPIPFSLGLRVKNIGAGTAYNLKIESAQPKIKENNQGLLIGFTIQETQVNKAPVTDTLLVDMGDILSNEASVARWIMTCTLSGTFESFTASVSHSDELGGELTSLIKQENINTHMIVHEVISDLPDRDAIIDFLAKDGSDLKIFESDSEDTIVPDLSSASSLASDGYDGSKLYYALTTTPTAGYSYIQMPDPQNGNLILTEVRRSDGKLIKKENAWLSKTRKANPEEGWDYFINVFDTDSTAVYTVTLDNPNVLPQAPVLGALTEQAGVEEQKISFLVQATDPNGTIPLLTASSMPVGAVFTDNQDETGTFSWTPAVGQAGEYIIFFNASDGSLEDTKPCKLNIYPFDDTDGDGMKDVWEMANFATLDRDGTGDYDGDGILDLDEFLLGTDPTKEDHSPSVPEIQIPAVGSEVTSISPELTIFNSEDPDGDAVTYDFQVFSDSGLTDLVADAQGVSSGSGTTSWPVPISLTDNCEYTWRVRAYDGVAYSLWAYGDFFVNTANDPPGTLYMSHPMNGMETSVLKPVLSVTTEQDPDQDTVDYTFELYEDAAMSSLVTTGTGNALSWTIDQELNDNTDYYWRVIAEDEHGAIEESSLSMFHVNTANPSPTIPTVVFPAQGSEVDVPSPDLTISNSTDSDPLTYIFEIDTKPTFASPDIQSSGPVPQGTDTTTWQVFDLTDNTLYYWRVKASDGSSESLWATGSFFVNLENQSPERPVLKNPGQSSWVSSLQPVLSVSEVDDPDQDDLFYRFEIYRDEELTDLVTDGQSTNPEWSVPSDLEDNTAYFWRVQAEDDQGLSSEWTEKASFFVKETQKPETIQINLSTSDNVLLEGINIYAFTAAGTYTGLTATTDPDGIAVFSPQDFSTGQFKFRADYMGAQFWSDEITIPGTYSLSMVIAEETVTLTVSTTAGLSAGVPVYLFSDGNSYLGIYATTDDQGQVTFTIPAGFAYKFRADIAGNQYWTDSLFVIQDEDNQFPLNAGGGAFTIAVKENAVTPMEGVRVYLFHQNGSYLSKNAYTDAEGEVAFDVPEGVYKVRADYLGYPFWSGDVSIVQDTATDLEIPHMDVTVSVNSLFQGISDPVPEIPVYLFTESGSYLSMSQTTDTNGKVVFQLPEKPYKVRADYLNQQFWSIPFTQTDTQVEIPMADAEVQVGWGEFFLFEVPVYAFTGSNSYLNLSSTTDVDGKVVFRLPAACNYKFRADYQADQYWSNEVVLNEDQVNPIPISTGGGSFLFTVLKGADNPLTGVNCHVFNEQGTYFGVFGPTNSQGEVTFDLAEGNFNIRVDYLGYQFWSPLYDVPNTLDDTLVIPHEDVVITINGVYQLESTPLENLPVYLFTPSETYLSINQTTDVSGKTVFNLPDQPYKVRADYMGEQYWSTEFNQIDTTIDIAMADAQITVTGRAQTLPGIPVYVFSDTGSYLGISQETDTDGQAVFRLPSGTYKFRADYQGTQFWTDDALLTADQVNPIEIATGGGPFVFTVLKDVDTPLVGVKCYVFNQDGAYLGLNATTNSEGQVSFELSDGTYRIRTDYLGYQFWSPYYDVPTTLLDSYLIGHQDVVIDIATIFQGTSQPLTGVPVYLFTASGSYMNQNKTTDASGQVIFSVPDQPYKVRADYLSQQFWSLEFNQTSTQVDVPMADAQITVTGGGLPLIGVPVYVFNGSNTYLNMNQATDENGQAGFRLPAGTYKFRADYQGSQYWSKQEVLESDQEKPVSISTGGGAFTLTVMKNATDPLANVPCYVFSDTGSYLGMSGTTDTAGQVVFNLSDGNYKFRVDHLGYQFWTDIYIVPDILEDNFLINHQDVSITVESFYQTAEPLAGIKVYLFKSSGSYMGQYQTTDANGQVVFNLPDQEYKVRADYLGSQFWSDPFQQIDQTVTINHGLARIHVLRSGVDLEGAKVYLFTSTGSYLSWYENTDVAGQAEFLLPDLSFKFRVDENGDQVWSEVTPITPGVENLVEINMD